MAIPLDIEDILGAGCLAALGRTLSALACLWLGAATGILGVESGALAATVIQGGTVDIPEIAQGAFIACLWGPFVMFGSLFILCFFPLLLAVVFTFVRGENGSLKKWVAYAAITGLITMLSVRLWADHDLLSTALAVVIWLGFVGSLALGAFQMVVWRRRSMAQHLIGLAAESDERRRSLTEEFGTAVADREYAIGDPNHVPRPPEASPSELDSPAPKSSRDRSE